MGYLTDTKRGNSLVGKVVDGKYKIEKRIGAGNMGVVYKATHVSLKKSFALKVLGPQWSCDEEAIQRFFREARAASLLKHPHIIETSDLGRAIASKSRVFLVGSRDPRRS